MASRADPGAPFRRETEVAIAAVGRALALARDGVGANAIASKGGRDIVTAADVAVEDAVREALTGALGIPVVGEERGGTVAADSLVGSATRRLHDELLDLAGASRS